MMISCGVSVLFIFATSLSAATRDVMVVTSIEEAEEPRVLEIYDFDRRTWRAIEKSETSMPIGPSYRAESLRPGSARLVENHSVLQYELRNGLSLRLASYPRSIEGTATLQYGDTFCLVGGYDIALRALRHDVLCWNPLTPRQNESAANVSGGWVALPNMTIPRHQPGAVVMDGKLYVVGGYDSTTHRFMKSLEVFDDITQRWYEMAPMTEARAGLQLVALSGKLYAIGGWKERRFLNVVEVYDPILNRWAFVSPMNHARAKFGTVIRDGEIYVVGGTKGFRSKEQLRSVEVYSPITDSWRELPESMTMISGAVRATVVKDIL